MPTWVPTATVPGSVGRATSATRTVGRVLDLPQARGRGAVAGEAVLGRSRPVRTDEDYYYLRGDVRKHPGRFSSVNASVAPSSAPTSEDSKSGDVVFFQGVADDPGNFDLEACGDLINPEEVRGKICVVVRGSCFFSSKTLACQRAGAVAAIIVNDRLDEGAADNWVTPHDPAVSSYPPCPTAPSTAISC